MLRTGACLCALWCSSSSAATPPAQVPVEAEPAQHKAQPVYKSIWRTDDKGGIVHLQSGLACDAQVGDFRRTGVTAFNATGLDISCNYMDAQKTLITIYLTRRANDSLADDFAEAERELIGAYPDASNISAPQSTAVPAGPAMQSAFYARQGGQIREGIWIGDLSGWTLEYRATWAQSEEAQTLSEIALLTQKAVQSASPQTGICAKAVPPVRDGAIITDKDEISQYLMMQSLLGAAEAVTDQKTAPGKPVTWCAEGAAGPADAHLLLWHAVYGDGSDASADKITPATEEEPMQLMSAPDMLANLADGSGDKKKADARPRWTVSVSQGQKVWIFAIYDGRPGVEALAQFATDIAADKAKPLGGYSVNGKNITIEIPEGH